MTEILEIIKIFNPEFGNKDHILIVEKINLLDSRKKRIHSKENNEEIIKLEQSICYLIKNLK